MADAALKGILQAERVRPQPDEKAEAEAALAECQDELPGLPKLRVRFYEAIWPDHLETSGLFAYGMPRTVWVRAGRSDVRDIVRHEVAHAAQHHSRLRVRHDKTLDGYARGSKKARRRLRRALRLAVPILIHIHPQEKPR